MSNYKQNSFDTNVHFSNAMFGEVERSRMTATPIHLTTFNAGDIVPIYCREILPQEDVSVDLDFVIRQTTLLSPTMGQMKADFYAFFVPNRIVNQSWKAVQGENYSGSWTANPVSLAPLCSSASASSVQIPVGSVADYYGFPTQLPIPRTVLQQCHDLKFRGYVAIYNEFFRDQNYQPPIPMSTLNVYQGFLDGNSNIGFNGLPDEVTTVGVNTVPDGSFGAGAIAHSLFGSGSSISSSDIEPINAVNHFKATGKPLKANKLHDYFTSVLPSPQKSSSQVFVPVSGQLNSGIPVCTSNNETTGSHPALLFRSTAGSTINTHRNLEVNNRVLTEGVSNLSSAVGQSLYPSNLATVAGSTVDGLEISVDDLRMSSAIQQVYETLGRGGSRYRELVSSFFGILVDDPYSDIPICLGHISRDLDLYQTAQTSASETGNTPQGNLTAFGYTASAGHLFSHKFIEHGYLHIFCVVRHRNIYSSYLARDNFRLNMLDFYLPPLANISEQPVYTREVNPFASLPDGVFGYQEAWSEYRFEPDMVTGLMRPGVNDTLRLWNYADEFDSGLTIATGNWLKSNSQQVLDKTLAVTSDLSPQLKGQFKFIVDKTLPMPTYSVPGMDII